MRACILALLFAIVPTSVRADSFDNYINTILSKVPESACAKSVKQLTSAMMGENDQVLPDTSAVFLVVRTNETRYSKLLVQVARRKVNEEKSLPVLLIDRFVTYRPGEDQAFQATGKNVQLFNGFRFSLDIGQVVPEELGGDLRFVAEGDKFYLETIGKAEMFVITKQLPEAQPKKTGKLVIGENFEGRYFVGKYKLFDDGKRSGTLQLTVDEDGTVRGAFVSDKDGKRYELNGKVGSKEKCFVQFTVTLPRTEQTFTGWMFTGDGAAITGSSRMLTGPGQQPRERGFYATRIVEK